MFTSFSFSLRPTLLLLNDPGLGSGANLFLEGIRLPDHDLRSRAIDQMEGTEPQGHRRLGIRGRVFEDCLSYT